MSVTHSSFFDRLLAVMRSLFPVLLILLLLSHSACGAKSRAWETWDDCRLETDKYFDGDSFHVRHGNEDTIVRLYFVDAPEINDDYVKSVAKQAAYFHVNKAQVLAAGLTAKEFTKNFLAGSFRVITRRKVAPGASRSERYYAIVESNGHRLDAALVEAGLARAHGEIADYPDADAGQKTVRDLRLDEQEAAKARSGLWAYSGGRVKQAAEEFKKGIGKFVDKVTGKKRINLNTATAAEIQTIQGIGPKTAEHIIQARPIKNLEALGKVYRIGPKKLAALRDRVCFE
jgi:competence ComEA-like helix-hairpin-helix protein